MSHVGKIGDPQPSCFQVVMGSSCVKSFCFITSVALIALAAVTYAGIYYPTSALGIIGSTFGHTGMYVTLGTGLGCFVMYLIGRCCCTFKTKSFNSHLKELEGLGARLKKERTNKPESPKETPHKVPSTNPPQPPAEAPSQTPPTTPSKPPAEAPSQTPPEVPPQKPAEAPAQEPKTDS